MSSNEDSGKDKARPADGSPPKKPYATIDLKATEITAKPAGSTDRPATASPPSGSPPVFSKPVVAPAAVKPESSEKTAPGSTSGSASPAKPADTGAATAKEAAKTDPTKAGGKADAPATGSQADRRTGTAGADARSSAVPAAGVRAKEAAAAPESGGFGRFLSHTAAAIVGGLVALFAADAIGPQLGITVGGQTDSGLERRLAALEQSRPSTASGDLAQRLVSNEERLQRLEETAKFVGQLTEASSKLAGETQSLQQKLGQGLPADMDSRLSKLESTLATLSAAANANEPGRLPQLAAVTTRLQGLEDALANQTRALRADLTQAIATRATQAAEAGEIAKSATQRLDRDVSAVKTETARLGQRVEALKADGDSAAERLRVVQEETGSIRSGLDGLKGDVETRLKSVAKPNDVSAALAPVSAKLAELEQSLQGVVKSESDRRSNAERIVLSLELGNLKRALDRGGSYASELLDVKKASAGRLDLATLDRYKDQGVATTADLIRSFQPIANAVIEADAEPADGSLVERLLAGAKSVVRVRKVEPSPGDKSAEAVVARIEADLKANKLGKVLEEAKALSPRAAAPARDWLDRVEARYSVERALSEVDSQLKSSLAGANGVSGDANAAGKVQN